jgi:hypothetical protein
MGRGSHRRLVLRSTPGGRGRGLSDLEPLVSLDVADDVLDDFEVVDDSGYAYHEWVIPADVANTYGPSAVVPTG